MGRLCKQKLFQGFRRVKVREESEGAEEQEREVCNGGESDVEAENSLGRPYCAS